YRLTMCLDSVRAAGLKPTELYVVLESVLTNPSTAGLYWWSTRITPLAATGVADPATAYDLQGGEPLPETLTLKSVWNPKKHLLTLSGKLVASGKPRPATRIHLFGGATADPDKMREIAA